MFGWLIDLMQQALIFLNDLVGGYGYAIIVFTLIIKFVLYPLTAKQTRSMRAMQDLQPELEKIKEKTGDDKQKQQQEMMKLYKEHNVNPAAGCLPMIFQLAILIPLYRAILDLGQVMDQASFLWIDSLAEPDVALVIINGLAMAGQTYITQKVSGSKNKNSMMMWMMPLFMLFIGFQLPSGILLYWVVSTLFTGVQQYILSKEAGVKEVVEE